MLGALGRSFVSGGIMYVELMGTCALLFILECGGAIGFSRVSGGAHRAGAEYFFRLGCARRARAQLRQRRRHVH